MSHTDTSQSHQVVGGSANPLVAKVWQLADPLCRSEGMELVHVEYQREQAGRVLRIYMDKPGGVSLDDCVNISRQLGDILDVGLDTGNAYRLEVSSPGIQRPLGKIEDFKRFKGVRAKIRTSQAINGQKNFSGTLDGVNGLIIQMVVKDRPISIALGDIVKAHLINLNGENACS
jgi:ribosome maturation factor RimP